jgi:hypothetical protein
MTEEDEEFERIAKANQHRMFISASNKEPRWKDHTKECPNCAKLREDIDVLMKRLERALAEKKHD